MLIFLAWLSFLGCRKPTVVIDGLHLAGFWRGGCVSQSYLSQEDFDKLRSGEEGTSLEVGLKSWCIVLSWIEAAGRWSGEVVLRPQLQNGYAYYRGRTVVCYNDLLHKRLSE